MLDTYRSTHERRTEQPAFHLGPPGRPPGCRWLARGCFHFRVQSGAFTPAVPLEQPLQCLYLRIHLVSR